MRKYINLYALFLSCFVVASCGFVRSQDSIISAGVLVSECNDGSFCINAPIRIQQRNGNPYRQIVKRNGEVQVNQQQKLKIRCFFPAYEIFVADAIPLESDKYQVFVNDKWYNVSANQHLKYYPWETFIKQVYIVPVDRKVFSAPNLDSPFRLSPPTNNYTVAEVAGDWLKLSCTEITCTDATFMGWVKWRERDKLLVQIGYIY